MRESGRLVGETQDDGQGCLKQCWKTIRRCAAALFIGLVVGAAVAVMILKLPNRGDGRSKLCKCVIPSKQGAILTLETTRSISDERGATANANGPGVQVGTTSATTVKMILVQNFTVIGNIDCSFNRTECLMEYKIKCAEVVPYKGQPDGCGPNGTYVTEAEPPEAADNDTLKESCWSLASYEGRVRASGIESIFRNNDTAGLVALNPNLESMCGDEAPPNALQIGAVVCLNPRTENICQIEQT